MKTTVEGILFAHKAVLAFDTGNIIVFILIFMTDCSSRQVERLKKTLGEKSLAK